jgi:hypothetical protein
VACPKQSLPTGIAASDGVSSFGNEELVAELAFFGLSSFVPLLICQIQPLTFRAFGATRISS